MAKIKNNGEGYVTIPRKISEHPYWNEKVPATKRDAIIDLFFSVRYGTDPVKIIVNKKLIELSRGEMIASLRFLENRWQWSKNKVASFLKQLQQDGIIELSETQAGTKLRLIDLFQGSKQGQRSGQISGHQEPLQLSISEESRDSDEPTEKDSEGTLTGQRRDKEEIKNRNKGKNESEKSGCKEVELPWQTESFILKWEEWKKYKKEQHKFEYKSPISENAALKDLYEFAKGNEAAAIQRINEAEGRGWQGLVFKNDKFKINGNANTKPIPQQQEAGTYGSF